MSALAAKCMREISCCLIAIAVARIGRADLITTNFTPGGDATGSFTDPAHWSNGAPTAGHHAFIDAANPLSSVVILSAAASANVGALSIDSGDTLWLHEGSSLNVSRDLESLPSTIENNGLIRIAGGASETQLATGQLELKLSGAGTVRLEGMFAQLAAPQNSTAALVNQGNTIEGYGTIAGRVVNQSVIRANVPGQTLNLNADTAGPSGILNSGTLRAESGGSLFLQSGPFNNAGGTIEALDGSTVYLASSTSGGTLRTFGTGVIEFNGLVSNVANQGRLRGAGGSLSGQIVNWGEIFSTIGQNISIEGETTLSGPGVLRIDSISPLFGVNGNPASAELINGADHTIRGRGALGKRMVHIVNHGLIEADRVLPLVVDSRGNGRNDGIMRAVNGGKLTISGLQSFPFDNTGGTIEANGASRVTFEGTIFGGTFNTTGGGSIQLTGNAGDFTNNGSVEIANISGQIVNNGILTVRNSTMISGETRITGPGNLILTAENSGLSFSGSGGARLINGPDHIIHGTGQMSPLGRGGDLTNEGMISADAGKSLTILAGGNSTNVGIMQATLGSTLSLSGSFTNIGGTIQALDDSEVWISANVTGGLVTTTTGGQVQLLR